MLVEFRNMTAPLCMCHLKKKQQIAILKRSYFCLTAGRREHQGGRGAV